MAEVSLAVDPTRATGSAAARRLRATGKVPAVLYGHGVEAQAVAVDRRQLRAALAGETGTNTLISLDVAGTRHLAMARQIQRDPIRNAVSHVDFVIVNRDEVVTAEVPVRLVGEATAVVRADGMVEQLLFTLLVHARPGDIPPAVDYDVSELSVGDTVRVGDLPLPAGVRADLDPEEAVIVVAASHVASELEQADEESAEVAGGGEPEG